MTKQDNQIFAIRVVAAILFFGPLIALLAFMIASAEGN